MRIFAALLLPVLCAGCVTTETVAFKPTGAV